MLENILDGSHRRVMNKLKKHLFNKKTICMVVIGTYSFMLLGCNSGGLTNSAQPGDSPVINNSFNVAKISSYYKSSSNEASALLFNKPDFNVSTAQSSFKMLRDYDAQETYIIHADSSNSKLSIQHLLGSGAQILMSGLSDGAVSEIKSFLGEEIGVKTDAVLSKVHRKVHTVYIMYRDSGTNKFHIKKYYPATDTTPQSIKELAVGYNSFAFKAQNQNSVENSAQFVLDPQNNLYVAFINDHNLVQVLKYDPTFDKFKLFDERYKKGINIPNAKEVCMVLNKNNLPTLAIAADNGKSEFLHLLSYDTNKGWQYYMGTTPQNLSSNKVDNVSLIIDRNGYPVMAYNSIDAGGNNKHLHLKRLHFTYNKTANPKTVYDIQELSNKLSYGPARFVKLLELPFLHEYYISYSDLGASPEISPNFVPGMVVVSRYNDDNSTIDSTRQYIDPDSASMVSAPNGQPNDIYANNINGDIIAGYSNPNEGSGLHISYGENHVYDTASNISNLSESPVRTVRKVFYTSKTFSGNLGGFTGADNLCQDDPNNPDLISKHKGRWHALLYGNPSLNFSTLTSYENTAGQVIADNPALVTKINWLNGGSALNNRVDPSGQLSEFWTGYYDYRTPIQGIQPHQNTVGSTVGVFTMAYMHDPKQFSCNAWTNNSSNVGGVYGNDQNYSSGADTVDMKLNAITQDWLTKDKLSKDITHTFNYQPNQDALAARITKDQDYLSFNTFVSNNYGALYVTPVSFAGLFGAAMASQERQIAIKALKVLIAQSFTGLTDGRYMVYANREPFMLKDAPRVLHSNFGLFRQTIQEYRNYTNSSGDPTNLNSSTIDQASRALNYNLNDEGSQAVRIARDVGNDSFTPDDVDDLFDQGDNLTEGDFTQNLRDLDSFDDQILDNEQNGRISPPRLVSEENLAGSRFKKNIKSFHRLTNDAADNITALMDISDVELVASSVGLVIGAAGFVYQIVDFATYISEAKSMPAAYTNIVEQGWSGGAHLEDVGYNLGVAYIPSQYDFSGNPITQPNYVNYVPYTHVNDYDPANTTSFYATSTPNEGNMTSVTGTRQNGEQGVLSYANICNMPLANNATTGEMNLCAETDRVLDQTFLFSWMDSSKNPKFGNVDYSHGIRYLIAPALDTCNTQKPLICVEE